MKISLNWLSDFIEWQEMNPQIIADRLTEATGEVDDIVMQGRLLKDCVVGKVLTVAKHPNADKLSLCDVETDKGIKRVVCGGTNLRPDMLVAFAHIGAQVKWHGGELTTLAPVKIRGEQSEGMICAAEELELETLFPAKSSDGERAIADLSDMNMKPGTPLKEALRLTDTILYIDNHAITNRPDLFSHIGFARECVALGLAKWKKKTVKKMPSFPKDKKPFECINDIPELIPHYRACMLTIDAIGETPDWMKIRLEATGWRSINLPIDITNYVTMELGMPLHSFDADDFKGDIRMRLAKAGEKVVTLDKVERSLPEGAIVISDDGGIFDLLGIMGGLRSSTKQTTGHIYLHSARVDPVSIRKAMIATGHRTDAATIYEKGVPPVIVEQGFERALELFLELVPGAKISSKMEAQGKIEKPEAISLSTEKVRKVLGVDVSDKEITTILESLECTVSKLKTKDSRLTTFSVLPPLHRLSDLTADYELIEEVARIHGYGKIEPIMPAAVTQLPPRDQRLNMLRDTLKAHQYIELIHLAFMSPALFEKSKTDMADAVTIQNPLGEELSRMRTHLLPSILETASRELKEEKQTLKLYEFGHVFTTSSEKSQLCMLIAAKAKPTLTSEPVLMLKADVQHAFSSIGYDITFAQSKKDIPAFAHPGRSADIICQNKVIGTLFEIHPAVRKTLDLPERAAAATIDWQAVLSLQPHVHIATPLPAFPSVIYDETLPLTSGKTAGELMKKLRSQNPLLISVDMIDLYESNTDKRMTLRFTYRSDERTLEQKETDEIHGKIIADMKRG